MSYKYYIDFGSGYTEVSANAEGVSLVRKKDDGKIYAKDSVDGDLKFYGTPHNLLLLASATKKDLPFKIELNSVEIYSGVIDLGGTYNIREKVSELPVVSIDPFKKMEDGLSQQYDIYKRDVTEKDTNENTEINFSNLPFIKTSLPDIAKVIYSCPFNLLVKYLIEKADDSILFDSDSFKYLDDSLYWQDISFSSVRAAANQSVTSQTNVSLNDLFSFFAVNFEMYPTLELIGGDYYFRLKHISEVTFTLGTASFYDMTTYKDVNWSQNKQKYSFDNQDRFWKIRRSNYAVLPDYIGVDMEFTQLKNVGNIKEVKNLIVTDVESIYATPDLMPIDNNTLLMLANEKVAISGNIFLTAFTAPLPTPYVVNFTPSQPEVIEIISSGIGAGSIVSDYVTVAIGEIHTFNFDIAITGSVNSVRLRWDNAFQRDLFDFNASENNNSTEVTSYLALTRLIIDVETFGAATITITSTGDNLLQKSEIYQTLKSPGILRPIPSTYNMPLAQSYLDSIAGRFNKYSTPALINNESTAVSLKKIKNVDNISVNMRSLLINFDYLVKTDLGEIEPTELKVDLNKGIAELTGKI